MYSRWLCLASFLAKEGYSSQGNLLIRTICAIDQEYLKKLEEKGKLGYSEEGVLSTEEFDIEEHYEKQHPNIYDLLAYYVWSPSKAKARGFYDLFDEKAQSAGQDPKVQALEKLIAKSREKHPQTTILYRATTSPKASGRVIESWTDSLKWAIAWGQTYLSEFEKFYILEAQVPRNKIQLSYLAIGPLTSEREILIDSRGLSTRVIRTVANK